MQISKSKPKKISILCTFKGVAGFLTYKTVKYSNLLKVVVGLVTYKTVKYSNLLKGLAGLVS